MIINTKNKEIYISSQFQNGFPKNLEDDPNEEPFWIFFFLLLPQVRISKIITQDGVAVLFGWLFWGVLIHILWSDKK